MKCGLLCGAKALLAVTAVMPEKLLSMPSIQAFEVTSVDYIDAGVVSWDMVALKDTS